AAGDAAAPPPLASTSAAPPTGSAPRPTPSAAPEKPALSVLQFTWTSGAHDNQPADALRGAPPGQPAWGHATARHRSGEGQRISLVFRVDGEERSTVDLKVDPSWSFRTWGYNTLRASDKTGELTVEVRELGGSVLTTAKLPIKAASAQK